MNRGFHEYKSRMVTAVTGREPVAFHASYLMGARVPRVVRHLIYSRLGDSIAGLVGHVAPPWAQVYHARLSNAAIAIQGNYGYSSRPSEKA